jgi:hypothetical protein
LWLCERDEACLGLQVYWHARIRNSRQNALAPVLGGLGLDLRGELLVRMVARLCTWPIDPVTRGNPMRALASALALATIAMMLPFLVACGNSDATPQPAAPTAAYGAPPPGYPPAPGAPTSYPPGYVPAPQYPAPTAAPYPQPSPAPVATYPAPAPAPTYAPPAPAPSPAPAPAPATTGSMATPGLLALPCQSDAICGLHHCNTQYGKCAFPCQTGADCVTNNCVMGVCLPGGGS